MLRSVLPAGATPEACAKWRDALPRHHLLPLMVQLRVPGCPSSENRDPPAAAACSGSEAPPPRIAMGLGGLVRTLTSTLASATLRAHLIDALGAPVTVFAALRVIDDRPVYSGSGDRKGGASLVNTSTIDDVWRALTFLGARREDVFIDHAKSYPVPSCGWYDSKHPPAAELRRGTCGNYLDLCAIQAFIGMTRARRQIFGLVVAHEARVGARFDSVLFMRPDMAVIVPVLPHCFQPLNVSRNKHDHLVWVPRHEMEASLRDAPDDFLECRRFFGRGEAGFRVSGPAEYNDSIIDDFVQNRNHHIGKYAPYWAVSLGPGERGQPQNWLKYVAARSGAQVYQDDGLGTVAILRQPAPLRSMPWVGHVCSNLAMGLLVATPRSTDFFEGTRFPYSKPWCYRLLHQNPTTVLKLQAALKWLNSEVAETPPQQ